jgi:hypothetical protein
MDNLHVVLTENHYSDMTVLLAVISMSVSGRLFVVINTAGLPVRSIFPQSSLQSH